ncbi:hypothetical protein [Mucilaginibacter flavus]|uniref:hypothetical protein n=1 Tax=Mucilaginibacter flavus TaxID=931504 RepID=UPI0025B42A9D|nr:hypothetical protein [Mucilaginibacter flavus]MDN3583987.1 hypothetical protein [Mucilaginibacter flavus]
MGLFYALTAKDFLESRNEIFIKNGIPALMKHGFEKSPYKGMRWGKLDAGTYVYDLCRLSSSSQLETITTYISKGDSWIKIYLNVFELKKKLNSLDQLTNLEGVQFLLPPNSATRMRLRSDDFEGMPLFNFVKHKVKSFYTKHGFSKRVEELGELISRDMNNIDFFVKRWKELHTPLVTDWEGNNFKKNINIFRILI